MKSLLSMVAMATTVAVSVLPVNILAFPATTTTTTAVHSRRIRRAPNLSSSSPSSSLPLPSSSSPSSSLFITDIPVSLLESTMEETLERTSSPSPDNNNNSNSNAKNLSPFLQGMVDEQRQLQMNVGKAMDTLRKDYPYFLKRSPEYSIYHDSITLSSSDGQIQLSKLSSYRKAFGIIRTMSSLLYDTDRSVIQSRMIYDATRSQIRVSYNARLVPKLGMVASLGLGFVGSVHRTVHVDGISVYSLDLSSTYTEDEHGNLSKNDGAGKILEHRIEKLLVNGAPLQPPYFNSFGFEMLSGQHAGGSLAGAGAWSFEQL